MVPTFTCGFFRSNFAFPMVVLLAGYCFLEFLPEGRAFYASPYLFAINCSAMCPGTAA
jgi:hypothetical protein